MWRVLDVGDVVGSLTAGDALVAAGSAGLGRTVSRTRPTADPDHLAAVEAGDLILSSARTLHGAGEPPETVIARLDRARIAGLVLHPDRDAHLPDALVAAADRAALPVIVLPEATSLAEVTAAVLEALLEVQQRRLDHVLDIHERFARTVVEGGGAPELLTTLHDVLGRPVAMVDADGGLVLTVPPDATIDLDPGSSTTVRHAIDAGAQHYGDIATDAGPGDLDAFGTIAMQRAAMGLAVRLAQANAVAEAQERFAAVSLEELIAGHGDSASEIIERGVTFGWDLTRPRAVLLASIDPPDAGPIPPNALGTIAAAARATLGSDAIVWTRSATVAALVAPETHEPGERRQIAEHLREELDARLQSVNVSIGIGRRVDAPTLLPRSYDEARRAVDVGRWVKGRHVTEVFDQLGLERLLASTPTDDLAEFVQHAIGALVAHDRANGTELVDTLAVWLDTRNAAEAARRVHVHYNTLKNRLDRIETIVGPVVTDGVRALECAVAIHIARHYEVPWERPHTGM